jgi:hypothetical protein
MKSAFFSVCILLSYSGSTQIFGNADSVARYLEGGWQWMRTCGGLAHHCTTPQSEGYTRTIRFYRVNGFPDSLRSESYVNGIHDTIRGTHIFTPIAGFTGWGLKVRELHKAGLVLITDASVDTLLLSDECHDCFTHKMVRDKFVPVQEEDFQEKTTLFPTPATDRLFIRTGRKLSASVYIKDMLGKQVYSKKHDSLPAEVNIGDLPSGVYLIEIDSPGISKKTKFVKL